MIVDVISSPSHTGTTLVNEIKVEAIVSSPKQDCRTFIPSDFIFNLLKDQGSVFLSSIKTEQTYEMPLSVLEKLQTIFEDLKFDSTQRSFVEKTLIKMLAKGKIEVSDINISQTSESEMLIYIENKDYYKNIIIDKDCDIELLKISKDSRQVKNKIYFLEDEYSLDDIILDFNDF